MRQERFMLGTIPVIVWGEPSDMVYIHVHGKMSRKEYAESFARIAESAGYQTVSFDLPEHGERADGLRCDVWNGVKDLNAVADHVFARWKRVSLFACSLGAYFSLNVYADRHFARCLFQSPIADMAYLVRRMMEWSNVTEDMLREKGEIDTPIDSLRWDYYSYILAHPVTVWHPTDILFGGKDFMQTEDIMRGFIDRFGGTLTVSPESEHPFMAETDAPVVDAWLRAHIKKNNRIIMDSRA